MMLAARYLLLGTIVCCGCHTAGKVAVTSFHVIDAPARYIRDRVDHTETTTTTTTTADVSDVSTPGRPLASPTPKVTRRETTTSSSSTAATTRKSPSSSSTTSKQDFPTAKPVPGKPGYVYSNDPKGGIIDVTGYKSGDKAKDPYTQQIFIVP